MEMEIGEYQKTLDEMLAAMANLHQEGYGSTIRIQELERRCEIASKQSGHLVSHRQLHMAEAWRKFEAEAQQMREAEMNAYQYGEKKDMESNAMMQQMRQAEGMIMEQKREIAVMRSYMASEKAAAQESATHATQIHREASQQISVYQQQIRGIESSTSIEKFNEEEMVQSLKSQLEHALVKRPEMYSLEDSREQLMTRLNDVTTFAEQESKRADCLLREKEEMVKQYESDVSKKDQMIAIEGGHRQDAVFELAQFREATQEERCTMNEKSKEAEFWKSTAKGMHDEYLEEMRKLQEQLKDRETTLKQEESFVRQLEADNEELRTFKKLEIQEASSKKDEHRERAVVKRLEGGPQLNSVREDKRMAGTYPSSSSNSIPNSSLVPGSILFPSFGDPMIDVHLSQMQGVVGIVPQPTTTTGGGGNGGGNNGTMDYNGFSPSGNQQGPGRRHLSLTGGGGGPPDDPPDDEDEDDEDKEDEEDEEEEEEDSRTRRGRRRLRDDGEIKNERPRISRKEAERVSIPTWPKIHQLDNWKMQLLMNVLSACADPDTDAWAKWLEQALGLNPDLNAVTDSLQSTSRWPWACRTC